MLCENPRAETVLYRGWTEIPPSRHAELNSYWNLGCIYRCTTDLKTNVNVFLLFMDMNMDTVVLNQQVISILCPNLTLNKQDVTMIRLDFLSTCIIKGLTV